MLKNIIILFSFCLFQLQAISSNVDGVFVINKSTRCKPATNYLTQVANGDTLIYTLKLKNTQTTNEELLIEIPIEQLNKINVQYKTENNIWIQYDFISKKLSNRIYYDRNIIFPVEMSANTNTLLYFKFSKKDIKYSKKPEILVWKKDAKITRTEALELTRGIFYGILILYSFICFLVTYMINVRNYYYYLFYLISGIVYLFVKNNLGYELFWPDYPNVDIFLKKIMLSIYLITSILFLRGFIKIRIKIPHLQSTLRYFIYFGFLLVFVSLLVRLLSPAAQNTFIIIQNIFAIVCFITVVITFIFVYFNTNDRSIVLFTLLYFLSFSFFLFYPQPEFGNDVFGVYLGQIYTYSNAFVIATIISISTVYRVLQIMKHNDLMIKEMSIINSKNNFSLIEGQQNERMRVGRELHDGIGIMMSAIKMRMSAIKTTENIEAKKIRNIIHEIDGICTNIRLYSHTLLPPTLKKFGLQIALKDLLEDYKHQQNIALQYNFNIPDNLSEVSQQLIFDLINHLTIYFSENKPEQLTISIYVISSINETQIRVQHTGNDIDINHPNIKSIISVIDLLHGKFQIKLLNAWNFKLQMEFPILLDK